MKVAFPGAEYATLRDVCLLRVQAAVSAFESGLRLESDTKIEARGAVHMMYLQRLDEMAADPGIARPAEALRLRAEEGQWLTEITKGVSVCFGCRRGECRFFGRNDHWIQVFAAAAAAAAATAAAAAAAAAAFLTGRRRALPQPLLRGGVSAMGGG